MVEEMTAWEGSFDTSDMSSPSARLLALFAESDLELFVPDRCLKGVLPDAILEQYQFWKTGPRLLRGYLRRKPLGVEGELIRSGDAPESQG
jgi:hypothetical protein